MRITHARRLFVCIVYTKTKIIKTRRRALAQMTRNPWQVHTCYTCTSHTRRRRLRVLFCNVTLADCKFACAAGCGGKRYNMRAPSAESPSSPCRAPGARFARTAFFPYFFFFSFHSLPYKRRSSGYTFHNAARIPGDACDPLQHVRRTHGVYNKKLNTLLRRRWPPEKKFVPVNYV